MGSPAVESAAKRGRRSLAIATTLALGGMQKKVSRAEPTAFDATKLTRLFLSTV